MTERPCHLGLTNISPGGSGDVGWLLVFRHAPSIREMRMVLGLLHSARSYDAGLFSDQPARRDPAGTSGVSSSIQNMAPGDTASLVWRFYIAPEHYWRSDWASGLNDDLTQAASTLLRPSPPLHVSCGAT